MYVDLRSTLPWPLPGERCQSEQSMSDVEYAGCWIRSAATLIDTLLLVIIIAPLLAWVYGPDYWLEASTDFHMFDFLVNYIFPAVAVVVFWIYKSATPGKMALKLTIVDARTGGKPTTGQLIGRYLGYYVSMLPLFLGIIWVGIDKRKQGFHDKLAGTVVVRNTTHEPVQFGE